MEQLESNKVIVLQTLIDFYANGNKAQFGRIVGLGQQAITNWLKRGTYDAELILKSLPDLSAEWLMRGLGPMHRSDIPSNTINVDVTNSGTQAIGDFAQASSGESSTITALQEQIKYQQSVIDKLLAKL